MSKPTPAADATTVANNFIKQYGKARFKRFLKLLKDGASGEAIADEYGVSRERVRQWKNTFGNVVQTYDISPDIQKLAGR
ncbi:MAG: helix-turn-helix domain-containing protein [Planctomycetes bacterium]|nr:helix-turn-helix domain-containing protein [Planctomycetota bacterium]MCW8135462.1 helix-turn-helix domain-containing protein [Planctomycetota bacterium]